MAGSPEIALSEQLVPGWPLADRSGRPADSGIDQRPQIVLVEQRLDRRAERVPLTEPLAILVRVQALNFERRPKRALPRI